MDRGHIAPFNSLLAPFSGRATNRPRVNMSAGCLVVTTVTTRVVTVVTTRVVTGHKSHNTCCDRCDRQSTRLFFSFFYQFLSNIFFY